MSLGPSTKFLQEKHLTVQLHCTNILAGSPPFGSSREGECVVSWTDIPKDLLYPRKFLWLKPKRPLWSFWGPHPVGACLSPGLRMALSQNRKSSFVLEHTELK